MPPDHSQSSAASAVDPDVDLSLPQQRREWSSHRLVLPVVAAGGVAGATARYLLATARPPTPRGLPWGTLSINVSGCFLIGVLMVFVVEVGGAHPLVRPLLGVGVLGGYTTFGTAAVDATTLLADGRPGLALAYTLGTAISTFVAVVAGTRVGRGVDALRRRLRPRHV